jgi:hypothetical protein
MVGGIAINLLLPILNTSNIRSSFFPTITQSDFLGIYC